MRGYRQTIAAVAIVAGLSFRFGATPSLALADELTGDNTGANTPNAITASVTPEDLGNSENKNGENPESPEVSGAKYDLFSVGDGSGETGSGESGSLSETGSNANGTSGGEEETQGQEDPSLSIQTHVQNVGWEEPVSEEEVAGTTGQGLRLEAVKVELAEDIDEYKTSDIEYRAHVENEGWQKWVTGGNVAGSTGKGERIEALAFRFKEGSALATGYDIWYRAHVQDRGWMAWACDGAYVGSTGKALRIEAIQLMLRAKGESAPSTEGQKVSHTFEDGAGVSINAHVQNIGWQGSVRPGQVAGTTGRGLRVEAFTARTENSPYEGTLEYRAHVQDEGWEGWRAAGKQAGTTGKARRVEAVQFRLSGETAQHYDLYYRAHVQDVGWLAWAKAEETDGAVAGTSSLGMRIEALQAVFVPKGGSAPSNSGAGLSRSSVSGSTLTYRADVKGSGWQADTKASGVAGTTGQGKPITGLEAEVEAVDENSFQGDLQYRAHVQDIGWQGWVSGGDTAGDPDAGKRIEAVQMQLTGELAKYFNIWYQAHISDVGWLGWAANGQTAGSTGVGKAMEAVTMRLVPKGSGAPGGTANHEVNKAWFEARNDAMTRRAQGYSSPTGYLIMVDYNACRVGVFTGSRGNWTRISNDIVSTGAPTSPTIHGVFSVGAKGYSFSGGDHTCYYYTQIHGDYLFHSILYKRGTHQVLDGTLGAHISGGCVRMDINRAKWLQNTVPGGSTIVVY